MFMQLRGTQVLVMGLGVHGGGLGVARWLLRQGALVTVTDLADAERLADAVAALDQAAAESGAQVRYVLGEHRAADFTSHAMLVSNPAVRPDSPWLAMARAAGLRIETEMTLFFRHCPGPILGVTGTKGKTTTATLLGAMLRRQFPDTVVAGNMRVSALEALEGITPTTPVVLELSSFQLMGLGEAQLSPGFAAITNLSADHLNYHGSMQAYADAKRQIYAHQPAHGVLVLNGDDALTAEYFAGPWPGQVLMVSSGAHPAAFATAPATLLRDGERVVRQDADGAREHLFDVADIRLPGSHNLSNVLIAAALAYAFGVSATHIRAAIRSFSGVEHRLELVRELDGVRYINDTTATNPAAAYAALSTIDAPIILLAGGADKQLDFTALAPAIAQRAKALVLLAGSATPRLQAALSAQTSDSEQAPAVAGPYDDFAAAIEAARRLAAPGDVVLLSPGCASFGMFRNEFHRGEEFRRIVCDLALGD